MDSVIYRDIAYDIGGDNQRIHQVGTRHSATIYKHCLLPVWSAAFCHRNKSYRFVINGRTVADGRSLLLSGKLGRFTA
jgi:hypothetical protein